MRIRTKLAAWLAALSLALMAVAVQPVMASGTISATLDQCANGKAGSARALCQDSNWQNGDLNENNSQYREGDSVPFRALITVAVPGPHKIWIQFDNTKSSKHAYDYLTTWDTTESGDPTTGHPPSDGTITTGAIATPANVFCASGFTTPPAIVQGAFTLYGATINGVSIKNPDGSLGTPPSCTGDQSVGYEIDFTTTAAETDLVLAWAGHIGSELNWGVGNSAVAISGSPYHQRILELDTTTIGNQDRSLKASAVLVPPTIATQVSAATVTKGQSVTDLATVSGPVGTPTGTVQFKWCVGSCATDGSNGTLLGTPITLNTSGQATSPALDTSALTGGTYCFFASFTPTGNTQYVAGTHTDTTNECFTVQTAAIHVLKTADAASVSAGDQVGFTITVFNSGAGDAYGVSLTDTLPAGLTWTIASQGAGWAGTCAINAGVLTCGPKTVAAGTTQLASTFTAHITATSSKSVCGAITNTANVSSTNDGSDTSTASVTVNCGAIQILKTADASPVNAGDAVGFTIKVWNSGTGDAYGVNLTDTLPAGLTWTVASQGAGWAGTCAINAGVLTCGPKTVAAATTQAATTFTVHVTATSNKNVCGTLSNTATVTSTNDGTQQSTASIVVNCGAVHVVKTADAASVSAGDQIGFTIKVYNDGAGDAYGVNLADILPGGLTWTLASQGTGWAGTCAINAGTLTCGPKTVAAGTSLIGTTFTVHITAVSNKNVCGSISNTANVTSTNDGSDASTASVTVNCADVHILKSADASPVNAGDTVGFAIKVWNAGTGDAYGVSLTDTLPAGVTWTVASQGTGWAGTCAINAGVLTCGPKTVAAGTTQAATTFTVHVTAKANNEVCGTLSNTATVTSSNDGTEQSSASIVVDCATIDIEKTADQATVNAGDDIGFVVTVTNKGDGTAYGVSVTDTLPANAGLNWSIDTENSSAGWSISAGKLLYGGANTSLAADASIHVHIVSPTTGATGPCPSGTVTNSATVTTSNDGTDTDEAAITVNCAQILIEKTADTATVNAGDQVGFVVTVTNNGTGSAYGVSVTDTLPTNTGLNWSIDTENSSTGWSISAGKLLYGGANTTLASKAAVHVHIVSPTTLATGPCPSGTVENTASVVTRNDGSAEASDSITVLCMRLALTKADNLNPNKYDHVGQLVTYTLTATNTGTGTLHGVTVSDSPALDNFTCTPTIPVATLAAGATVVCTGTHAITQADLDVGSFKDTASASSSEVKAPDANDTILGLQTATIGVTKTDNYNPTGKAFKAVGEVVTYTIVATNTGNVTLHNVTVSDAPALDGFACSPTIPVATLAPGAKITCTGTHTITAADLNALKFVDTATATATEASASATDTVFGEKVSPATSKPSITPPPTSTGGGSSGGGFPLFALFLCAALGACGLLGVRFEKSSIRK